MKTQPMDVVVGGAYDAPVFGRIVVTEVKPKGRGFYVTFRAIGNPDDRGLKIGLEQFRRMCGVNQREVA